MSETSDRVTPKQQRAQDRRQDILTAAASVYDQQGRDRFNVRDVAREAQCSVATVYRYFRDRNDLMDEIRPARDSHRTRLERVQVALDQHKQQEGEELRVHVRGGWVLLSELIDRYAA